MDSKASGDLIDPLAIKEFIEKYASPKAIAAWRKSGPFRYPYIEDNEVKLTIRQFYDPQYECHYFGQCNQQTREPHGRGIEIDDEGSISEGYWKEGVLAGPGL